MSTLTPRARRLAARRDPPTEANRADDPTLAELGISPRYHDDLHAAGLTRLSQLVACGDLTQIKGIGPKASEEIRERIAAWQTGE